MPAPESDVQPYSAVRIPVFRIAGVVGGGGGGGGSESVSLSLP
jgi:hypothetical protein